MESFEDMKVDDLKTHDYVVVGNDLEVLRVMSVAHQRDAGKVRVVFQGGHSLTYSSGDVVQIRSREATPPWEDEEVDES